MVVISYSSVAYHGLLKQGTYLQWWWSVTVQWWVSGLQVYLLRIAGIPPGKSDASGGIGPRPTVTSTSGFSARCRRMRPIFPVEFQLKTLHLSQYLFTTPDWPCQLDMKTGGLIRDIA